MIGADYGLGPVAWRGGGVSLMVPSWTTDSLLRWRSNSAVSSYVPQENRAAQSEEGRWYRMSVEGAEWSPRSNVRPYSDPTSLPPSLSARLPIHHVPAAGGLQRHMRRSSNRTRKLAEAHWSTLKEACRLCSLKEDGGVRQVRSGPASRSPRSASKPRAKRIHSFLPGISNAGCGERT